MSLQLIILRALDRAAPYQLPDQTLRMSLTLSFDPPPDDREVDEALSTLETKRQLTRVDDEDRGPLWELAPAGKSRLQRNNITL